MRAQHQIDAYLVKGRVEQVMGSVGRLMESDPSALQAQTELNRSRLVIDLIQPYFYGISGALHENPPGRQERIVEVESLLAPYESTLLRMLSSSARDSRSPNAAAQLLAFCKPSPSIRNGLLSVARDPLTDPQKAGEAYETLFMLELDDAQVRQEVVEKIAWRDERHTRASLASDLLMRGATRWALEELREKYKQFLSIPFNSANYPKRGGRARLRGDYGIAVRGLKAFGMSGKEFVPLLEARQAELDPNEDSDLISSCTETLLMLQGEAPPRPVCNWKGSLLGVSKVSYPEWKRVSQSDSKESVRAVPQSIPKGAKQPVSKGVGGGSDSGMLKSPTSWEWYFVTFVILAGCGYLFLRKRQTGP